MSKRISGLSGHGRSDSDLTREKRLRYATVTWPEPFNSSRPQGEDTWEAYGIRRRNGGRVEQTRSQHRTVPQYIGMHTFVSRCLVSHCISHSMFIDRVVAVGLQPSEKVHHSVPWPCFYPGRLPYFGHQVEIRRTWILETEPYVCLYACMYVSLPPSYVRRTVGRSRSPLLTDPSQCGTCFSVVYMMVNHRPD